MSFVGYIEARVSIVSFKKINCIPGHLFTHGLQMTFNSSPPKSDYNISPESHDHQLKRLLIVKQVLLVSKLKMSREKYGGYVY